MSAWKVTHIDQQHQRHVLHVLARSSEEAQEQVDMVYGPPLVCHCMHLGKRT